MQSLISDLFQTRKGIYLSIFRFIFGLLMLFHFILFIPKINTYVGNVLLDYSYYGLGFVKMYAKPLMYILLGLGVLSSLLFSLGFFYRLVSLIMTIIYGYFFFSDKLGYTDHTYLLLVFCLLFCLIPAGQSKFSLKNIFSKKEIPYWYYWIFQMALVIVYFYSGLSKLHPDWLDGTLLVDGQLDKLGIGNKPFWSSILSKIGFLEIIIAVLFLFRKTKIIGCVLAIISVLAMGILFQSTGIPTLLHVLLLFVFITGNPITKQKVASSSTISIPFFIALAFLFFQAIIPARHYFISGDVDWNRQGFYFSWRERSVSRFVMLDLKIFDQRSGKLIEVSRNGTDVMKVQSIARDPYMVYQLANNIKKKYAIVRNQAVNVRVTYAVSLNGRELKTGIFEDVNLDQHPYRPFQQNTWITASPRLNE